MPDYASILRRSIAALPNPGPDMRQAVYQRARAALARQLTAIEPPLTTREIDRQHQELEDAVARIEADYAAEAGPAEDEFFIPEEELRHDVPPRAPLESNYGAGPVEPRVTRDLTGERVEEEDEEDEEDEYEEEAGSRVPLLVGLILVALVIIGAGAYAFAERETLLSFLGLSDAEDRVATFEPPAAEPEPVAGAAEEETPEAAPPPQTATADKDPDRLTNGGALPEPEPPAVVAAAPPEAPVSPEDAAPAPTPPPTATTAEPLTPAPPTPGTDQTAALETPSEGLVGQRAIYYFQGTEGQPGRATEGNVTWAEITKDGRPAIQATLRLEQQNVSATVTIHRNEDATLPASHLVEVQFSGNIGDSPIQRVPAIVVKKTEQARGEPLSGAAVPVTSELFWIALSDDMDQVTRNVQLLREGSWFDIPILFQDGTRALLVFEKGIPGERVFETVMASWSG
jgi:hypothetical protein